MEPGHRSMCMLWSAWAMAYTASITNWTLPSCSYCESRLIRSSPAHRRTGVGGGWEGRALRPPSAPSVPVHTCAFPSTLLILYARTRQFAFEVILPEFCKPDVPSVVFQGPGREVLIEPLNCCKKIAEGKFSAVCPHILTPFRLVSEYLTVCGE